MVPENTDRPEKGSDKGEIKIQNPTLPPVPESPLTEGFFCFTSEKSLLNLCFLVQRAGMGTPSKEGRMFNNFLVSFSKDAWLTEHMRHSKVDSVPRSFKFTTVKIVKLSYF